MYGVVLIFGKFREENKFEERQQFKALATAIETCVPQEKQEMLKEEIEEQAEMFLTFLPRLVASQGTRPNWRAQT